MTSASRTLLVAPLVALGLFLVGCDEIVDAAVCNRWCDFYVDCMEDEAAAIGCDFRDDAATVIDSCRGACNESMDDLTNRDRDAVADCVACISGEMGNVCSDEEIAAIETDQCANDCDADDIADFHDEFDGRFALEFDWEGDFVCE